MKRGKSKTPAKHKPKQIISAAHHAAAMVNLRKAHEAQRTLPRCGAKCRTTGAPCGNLALENGRCRLHGGRTPKGKDWHKVQLSNPGNSIERLVKKEAEVAARRKRQEQRRRAMTPEQRAEHEAWHKAHRPGSATERERARKAREAQEWLQDALRAPHRPDNASDDARALSEAIRTLEAAERAGAKRLTESAEGGQDEKDVFG